MKIKNKNFWASCYFKKKLYMCIDCTNVSVLFLFLFRPLDSIFSPVKLKIKKKLWPYSNFIENQMVRLTVWHGMVHTFFRQVLLILEWHLPIFDFEFKKKKQTWTKILRKLWCARFQIGVEGVEGIHAIFFWGHSVIFSAPAL